MAVIVCAAPDVVNVIECDASTPLLKFALGPAPALMALLDVKVTVFEPPLKAVTALLNWSSATTRTLNAAPAVCVAIVPPEVFVTAK